MNPESPIAAPPPVPTISTNSKAAAQAAADAKNIVRRKLTGYVGFANLPNQWHRKSVRKGFNFNVMVVGMLTDPRRLEHVLMGVGCR
jgi:septin 7